MNKEETGAQQRGLVRLPMMVAWALGAPTLWLPASRFPGPLEPVCSLGQCLPSWVLCLAGL